MFKIKDIVSYLVKGGVVLGGFLFISITTKKFSLEVFGIYTTIVVSLSVIISLFSTRSAEGVTTFLGKRNRVEGDNFLIIKLAILLDLLVFIASISLFFLSVRFSDLLLDSKINSIIKSKTFIIFSITFFAGVFKGGMTGFFQNKNLIYLLNFLLLTDVYLDIFIIYQYSVEESNIYFLLEALSISKALSIIVWLMCFLWHLKKHISFTYRNLFYFNKTVLSEYLKFSLKTFTSTSIKSLYKSADTIYLALFTGPLIVGEYHVLKKLISPIGLISEPLLLNYTSVLVDTNNKMEQIWDTIRKINFKIVLVSILYLAVCVLLSNHLIDMISDVSIEYAREKLILIGLSSVATSLLWWSRIISNRTNPNYSILGNIIALILSHVLIYTSLWLEQNLISLLISQILIQSSIYFYWDKIKQKINE